MRTKKKILFNFTVVLLVAGVFVLFFLSISKYIQRRRIGQNLQKNSIEASYSIEQILSSKKSKVVKIAQSRTLKPGQASSATERVLRDFCSENDYFIWALVTDSDGVVIASSDSNQIDEDFFDNEAFEEAVRGENWTTEMQREDENRSAIYFAVPIYEEEKIVGAFIAALDGESLNSVLRKAEVDPEGIKVIVDRNGQVIAAAKKSDVFKLSLADYKVSQSIFGGACGFTLGKDVNGRGMIFGYAPTNAEQGWTVLLSSPFPEGRRADVLGFSATLLLLFLALFVSFGRSFFHSSTPQKIQDVAPEQISSLPPSKSVPGESQSEPRVTIIREDFGVSLETESSKAEPSSELNAILGESRAKGLVDKIISKAVIDRASDIHLEPQEDRTDIRYRIDGVLHLVGIIPKELQPAVLSRIKAIAYIAEKELAQDGRIQMKIGEKEVDLRISSFPTIFGEKFVLRILDKDSVSFHLNDLGFLDDDLRKFYSLVRKSSGLVLIVGPTGSGKTTTLYATLNAIRTTEENIVTLEDPVEHRIEDINQGQINPKAGLTFARGLRLILRQDPDVVMVGEIRDLETTELAIHAALTGHLVLSALQTMDAPSTLTRLIDMGIEPFLIASAVSAVVAQRLIRTICPSCKEEYAPSKELLDIVGLKDKDLKLYHGRGCPICLHTGFKGRTGLFEMLVVNEIVRELIMSKATTDVVRQAAKRAGMKTFLEDGLEKVLRGITTLEELLKVIQFEHQVAS